MHPRFIVTLVIALLAVTLGGVVALKKLGPAGGGKPDEAAAPGSAARGAAVPGPGQGPVTTLPGGQAAPSVAGQTPEQIQSAIAAAAAKAPRGPDLPQPQWEERVSELLVDESIEHREAGQKMVEIASWANVPEEARMDALQHGLNLIDDDSYIEDVLPLVTRIDLPEEMHDILFADLHNRPEEVSVPVAKEIARLPAHPLAEEAKDFVDFFEDANLDP